MLGTRGEGGNNTSGNTSAAPAAKPAPKMQETTADDNDDLPF